MGEGLLVGMLLHFPEHDGMHGLGAVVVDFQVEHGGTAHFGVHLFQRQSRSLHGDVVTLGGVEHTGDHVLRARTARRAFAATFTLLHAQRLFNGHV